MEGDLADVIPHALLAAELRSIHLELLAHGTVQLFGCVRHVSLPEALCRIARCDAFLFKHTGKRSGGCYAPTFCCLLESKLLHPEPT